jgi:hypothetical protein
VSLLHNKKARNTPSSFFFLLPSSFVLPLLLLLLQTFCTNTMSEVDFFAKDRQEDFQVPMTALDATKLEIAKLICKVVLPKTSTSALTETGRFWYWYEQVVPKV